MASLSAHLSKQLKTHNSKLKTNLGFLPVYFQVCKLGCAIEETQRDHREWAVAVLGYMYLRYAFLLGLRVVHLLTVNEHPDVRILLNRIVDDNVTGHKIMKLI